MQNLLTKIAEAASFLSPEIQAIPDDLFAKFLDDPSLTEWRIALRKIRRMKPHVLSEREERLLALGSAALDGYDETFSQLTDVDMKFGVLVDEKGEEKPLTQSSFSSFLVKRDHGLRKRAFHKFYEEFQDHQFTLAASLAYSVKADVFRARARNYPSALEASLFRDDIPATVYDGLISAVRNNVGPLFRYYDLRRRVLGLDELHHYDTYVPLVAEIESHVSFDEAIETILRAFEPLGPEYTMALSEGLRCRWCDRYETKGKRSGAFSSGSFGAPPYILMNYKSDVFSDVYTLAHEAGHSMHTWFAQRTQLYQDYNYPIFLAEVASTFNEELLTHHLLEKTQDKKMRAYIINRQIDDIRGTLFRQTMFAEFEKIIHAIEERGDALTLDVFKSEYHALLEAYFGSAVALDPQLDLECLRIPHFYNAFYVYKYATGISAAVALSERVLNGEPGAVAAYLDFLKSGGSKFPLETLRAAGVDMATSRPIESALRLFERRLTELESLLL
jgi:oligoendopeptidase F